MKVTVNNLTNKLDECSDYCMERAMSDGCGEEYEAIDDGQSDYNDKHRELRELIGGNYGTNDTCVYSGILSYLDTAREAKMWQNYAHWLEEELANEREGVDEEDFYDQFSKWYEKHCKWDKEKKL
tara:strand:+ start:48 stop:422 length:375 start_codon:yes stop_codon:yes gene_type:complete